MNYTKIRTLISLQDFHKVLKSAEMNICPNGKWQMAFAPFSTFGRSAELNIIVDFYTALYFTTALHCTALHCTALH